MPSSVGLAGSFGAVRSMVSASDGDAAPTLPAWSIARTRRRCDPSKSVVGRIE